MFCLLAAAARAPSVAACISDCLFHLSVSLCHCRHHHLWRAVRLEQGRDHPDRFVDVVEELLVTGA
jgi:hypothetical protein